jgi:two-component system response regulator HydG
MRVLCVDDEPDILDAVGRLLEMDGYEVARSLNADAALRHLQQHTVDVAVVDIRMPGMNGLELTARMRREHPGVDVVILTGNGGYGEAVDALRSGAADFIEKPFEPGFLRHRLAALRERRSLRAENRQLQALVRSQNPARPIVGKSPAVKQVVDFIDRVKDDPCTVLLQGESGTGKEQVARTVHAAGARAQHPFVTIDCTTLTPALIESELFGHAKGAFTGASGEKAGLLASAGEGTVFIDEVTEQEPAMQAKLLRALQEREFRPVGSTATVPLRARVIAATRRDLESEVREGRFREDLYYRLNVVEIRLPPLRERREDIPVLVRHFLDKYGVRRAVESVEEPAMHAMETYGWPGNVRELEHVIERALVLGRGPALALEELPEKVRAAGAPPAARAPDAPSEAESLSAAERRTIASALRASGWNKRQAARVLDISVTTLYEKIKRYGLQEERA